jgi:hypothetical protein
LITISRSIILTYIATILVTLLVCFPSSLVTQAQSDTAFTSTEKFEIPTHNSTINFAINGSFEQASIENDMWIFTGLKLSNLPRQEKQNLTVSAQDSNITITLFQKFNTTIGGARLRYVVSGQGKQIFNIGLLPKDGDWSVTFNGVYIAKNDGWEISSDGKVTVTGATSLTNITITCYSSPPSLRDSLKQPFIQQHSVAIATAIALTTTIILVIFIRISVKKAWARSVPIINRISLINKRLTKTVKEK